MGLAQARPNNHNFSKACMEFYVENATAVTVSTLKRLYQLLATVYAPFLLTRENFHPK